jgi:hypothetical protein
MRSCLGSVLLAKDFGFSGVPKMNLGYHEVSICRQRLQETYPPQRRALIFCTRHYEGTGWGKGSCSARRLVF